MHPAAKYFLIPFLAACLAAPSALQAAPPSYEELESAVEEFDRIDEGLYRGAQPEDEDFRLLRDFGIRTVVNFRHEEDVIEEERALVEALGMNYVSLPWRIQWHPDEPVMRQFLDTVADPSKGPFFVHCRRGAERTGVADAVYRHLRLARDRDTAWEEASEGHHLLWHWKPFTKKRYSDFLENLKTEEA